MQLIVQDDLPFTTVKVAYARMEIEVPDVLIDTGSATTVLAADIVASIGIIPEPSDLLYTIRGVGGTEVVFVRRLERLAVGSKSITGLEVEIGGMDYGFPINGILGTDFLIQAGTIINLRDMQLQFVD
ncbi:MAG: retroviral-like aspartic protease family protein [Chloroflexi bacterium]|nr:retroviral-like aspartic protease family protein [Chloroflexota bacterium]MCI0645319.1 retroviral-like aspartic protease family protein [Chloroflexota bacterium]MCI0729527.1 retroviral-like aspartic protease family protein [Chloroflexota bacterium]